MLELETENITAVNDSEWLYGFILHYLQLRGETHKHDLLAKIQMDVKYTFPNLNREYFYERYDNAENIFMTLFYYAIFHLREKGYGLIYQKIKKNEPIISLSPIGHEFLALPEGKQIFIDYQDIEAFLHLRHPQVYEKAIKQIEQYRSNVKKLQDGTLRARAIGRNNKNSIFRGVLSHFRLIDILLILLIFIVLILVLYIPENLPSFIG